MTLESFDRTLERPAELFKECPDFEKMRQSFGKIRQALKTSAIALKNSGGV
jgi:hypothetical protein